MANTVKAMDTAMVITVENVLTVTLVTNGKNIITIQVKGLAILPIFDTTNMASFP